MARVGRKSAFNRIEDSHDESGLSQHYQLHGLLDETSLSFVVADLCKLSKTRSLRSEPFCQ